MLAWKSAGSACALALGAVAWAGPVYAQDRDKTQCARAYERAQEHRAASRLTKARDELVICAQQACPAFVQSDCVQWLTEVEREMPSVVISAKGKDGSDTVEVRVLVDGELFAEQLDGKTRDLDPGMHVFRFEHADADAIERRLLVKQGQKSRLIEVSFAEESKPAPAPVPAPPPDAVEASDAEPAAPTGPGPLRPYAFVAGGVGALGLAGFGVFALLGKSEQSELEDRCAPSCTDEELAPVRTKYLIADVSLGVGVAGLATGVVLFFLSQPKESSPAADTSSFGVDVETRRGGGFATLSGRF